MVERNIYKFRGDYIFVDRVYRTYKNIELGVRHRIEKGGPITDEERQYYDSIKKAIDDLDKCKIFKVGPEQVNVFYQMGVDMNWDSDQAMGVRLPFQDIYIEFTDPIIIYRGGDERDKIRGAQLCKIDEKDIAMDKKAYDEGSMDFSWEKHVERSGHQYQCSIIHADMSGTTFFDIVFGVQFPCSDFPCGQYKESENTVRYEMDFCTHPYHWGRVKSSVCPTILHIAEMGLMIQHTLNYINSRNVDRVYVNPNSRKRVREGKELLPYYECKIHPSKTYDDYHGTGKGTAHSFRYDVRGHFRKIEKGFIWVTGHQRGLRHTLYKPKIWVKGGGMKR